MKIEGRRLSCIYVISAWGETWTANSIIDVYVGTVSFCVNKAFVCLFLVIDNYLQKFRAYVLDSEGAMDLLAYLLCYGLEIKDKPGGCTFHYFT